MTKKIASYEVRMAYTMEYDDSKETAEDAAYRDLYDRLTGELVGDGPLITVYYERDAKEE